MKLIILAKNTRCASEEQIFLNDVTQDTDARNKYSLRTKLGGKLFLPIQHNTQKEPYSLPVPPAHAQRVI